MNTGINPNSERVDRHLAEAAEAGGQSEQHGDAATEPEPDRKALE
jgi:hypothetical protein